MNDEERKAWEDTVQMAKQPTVGYAGGIVNFKTIRWAAAELAALREERDRLREAAEWNAFTRLDNVILRDEVKQLREDLVEERAKHKKAEDALHSELRRRARKE